MAKTVACLVLKTPKVFTWLGHMPVMNWGLTQLQEARGIERIVCVPAPELAARAKALLSKEKIEIVPMPRDVALAPRESVLHDWLTAANGPAAEAEIIVLTKATSPFLPAAKIEACVAQVARGKCSVCLPARASTIVTMNQYRKAKSNEPIDGLMVFRVNVPQEKAVLQTVRVNLMESLDVDNHDEFVLVSALVDSDKV